jgi:hypothetical protein
MPDAILAQISVLGVLIKGDGEKNGQSTQNEKKISVQTEDEHLAIVDSLSRLAMRRQ